MSLVRACEINELEPGEATQVPGTPPIAVYNVDGEFFATADMCSHDDSSLSDGYIEGDQVECSWHFAKFCIRTGQVLSAPANRDIETYPVIVENGVVYVETK